MLRISAAFFLAFALSSSFAGASEGTVSIDAPQVTDPSAKAPGDQTFGQLGDQFEQIRAIVEKKIGELKGTVAYKRIYDDNPEYTELNINKSLFDYLKDELGKNGGALPKEADFFYDNLLKLTLRYEKGIRIAKNGEAIPDLTRRRFIIAIKSRHMFEVDLKSKAHGFSPDRVVIPQKLMYQISLSEAGVLKVDAVSPRADHALRVHIGAIGHIWFDELHVDFPKQKATAIVGVFGNAVTFHATGSISDSTDGATKTKFGIDFGKTLKDNAKWLLLGPLLAILL